MGDHVREVVRLCQLLVIFTTLTLLFYGGIVWIGGLVEENYREDGPRGRAVKVFDADGEMLTTLHDVKQRLMFYYWYGE
ncbi:DUF4227 family protein [Caldalkalibacillus salinus]|uniref:DUF4227 family protein n=1 Tax=Caldalkalibacillus salinus TaxID=2803787 RepID=UPI001921376D|nr:DUF4227 family protein [Caldalkalibacillus salinus]